MLAIPGDSRVDHTGDMGKEDVTTVFPVLDCEHPDVNVATAFSTASVNNITASMKKLKVNKMFFMNFQFPFFMTTCLDGLDERIYMQLLTTEWYQCDRDFPLHHRSYGTPSASTILDEFPKSSK
jgi:hypothetical protein